MKASKKYQRNASDTQKQEEEHNETNNKKMTKMNKNKFLFS